MSDFIGGGSSKSETTQFSGFSPDQIARIFGGLQDIGIGPIINAVLARTQLGTTALGSRSRVSINPLAGIPGDALLPPERSRDPDTGEPLFTFTELNDTIVSRRPEKTNDILRLRRDSGLSESFTVVELLDAIPRSGLSGTSKSLLLAAADTLERKGRLEERNRNLLASFNPFSTLTAGLSPLQQLFV